MESSRSEAGSPRPQERHRREKPRPDGPYWLYGVHSVTAALANSARRWTRLFATTDGLALLPATLREGVEGRVKMVSRGDIGQLLPPGAPHQGLALEVQPLVSPPLAAVATPRGDRALVVVLDQVADPHNIGAILRSAAAFGAQAVISPERHAPGETGALAKAASGALDLVPFVRVVNLARALEELAKLGYWRIGLAADAPGVLTAAGQSGPVALVLGAEGHGLRRLTGEHCDELVRLANSPASLPKGAEVAMPSLNVSNAAAIALYEFSRPATPG